MATNSVPNVVAEMCKRWGGKKTQYGQQKQKRERGS